MKTVTDSIDLGNKTYEATQVVFDDGGGGGGGSAKITFDITPPEGVTLDDYVEIRRFSNSKEETSQSVYITGGAAGPMSNFVVPVVPEFVTGAEFIFYDADENVYIFSDRPQIEGDIVYENTIYVITGDCKFTGTVVLRS